MFGYVTANRAGLSPDQARRYKAYYCGLCRRLRALHGVKGQLTLSYDTAFLAILLSGLYEPESREEPVRCLLHPLRQKDTVCNEFTDYAADMTLELGYRKLLDNWQDERRPASRLAAAALEKRHLALAGRYPRQCAAIHLGLAKLAEGEAENRQDPDAMSSYFGAMLAELFDLRRDEWSAELQEMGMSLGKFIYLMDAYEDLPGDRKKGRYNPLQGMAAGPGFEAACHRMLTALMAQCAAAFERLPILQDADILRNILYSGVWVRYAALQKERGGPGAG